MSNVPKEIKQIEEAIWEIPETYKKGMRVPARIIANKEVLHAMDPGVFDQVTNVACLPGIVKYALCLSDGHWGYGFPIGGVAAFDTKEGVISPGGIGFDINCGMRLVTTNLTIHDVQPKIKELIDTLFKIVPAGVGSQGFLKVDKAQFRSIMEEGTKWCVDNGYGWKEDLGRLESNGRIPQADASTVTDRAFERGIHQLGTLGSGNHYLEIQHVKAENIIDERFAKHFGIFKDQIVIMFHCGSRGFGHQLATDYLKIFDKAMQAYGIKVNDRELSCAPFSSEEGQRYYKAMACAANMAFANRQVILHRIREGFSSVFKKSAEELEMHCIYDVSHNLARISKFKIERTMKELLVHRKGSTFCAGPDNEETPVYCKNKGIGSPLILGGSMETGSALLVGTNKADQETFSSTAHGSGRTMSRTQAKNTIRGDQLQKDMLNRGIYVKSTSMSGLAEEAGIAYKNLGDVIDSITKAGISVPTALFSPIGNIKGNISLPSLGYLLLVILIFLLSFANL